MSIKFPLVLSLAILGCGAFSEVKAQPVSPLTSGDSSVYVNETVVVVRRHRRGHWENRVWRDRYGRRHVRRVWVRY